MPEIIVKAKNLQKIYGSYKALDGFDINVPEGCVYGLLGKNGAGKTTVLRIFMSLVKASSGEVLVMGDSPWKMEHTKRQFIGYASDSMQLIPWLKVGELLNYNGSFYKNWDLEYVKQWVERLNLPINKRVFTLSRGNRQKLGLIMAIGHRPKLLILDEPAGGLDPVARKEFLESMIDLIHESGTTIIISSHQLYDLERISDYIGIIDNGKMKVEMEIEKLKSTTKQVKIYSKNKTLDLPSEFNNNLLKIEKTNNNINCIFKNWNENISNQLKGSINDASFEINSLGLEEIFLSYIDN